MTKIKIYIIVFNLIVQVHKKQFIKENVYFRSGTDLIHIATYLVVVVVVRTIVFKKSPRHRRFKPDRDEI